MDHAGGARAFIAEGATVIVPAPGKAYFEMLARRPHTIVPDELQMKPRPAKVEDVADERILKDESGEIRLYNVDNPHVKGMLMVHLPQPNIVYVTDILSIRPPFDRTPGTVAVGAALRKYGINDAMIAAGHGTNRKQSELGAQIGQEVGSR
jgi:glyoxylase-like metal-dependent hydrolase (beta-lactamase superfamily II)